MTDQNLRTSELHIFTLRHPRRPFHSVPWWCSPVFSIVGSTSPSEQSSDASCLRRKDVRVEVVISCEGTDRDMMEQMMTCDGTDPCKLEQNLAC